MDEQQMAAFMAMSPEEQQAYFSQQQQPPQVDPKMGMPGQSGMTPQQKIDGGDPRIFDDYAGKGALIGDQQAQAEALRQTPSAEGMQTQNAGFVAANPLSHLASGLKQGMGNYQAKEALAQKQKLSDTVSNVQRSVGQTLMDKVQADKQRAMAKEMRENRRGTPDPYQSMNA